LKLHSKYGRIVRTGPDQVSVGDPAAINIIYNANDKFKKVGEVTCAENGPGSNQDRSPLFMARSRFTTKRACSRTRWSLWTRPCTRA
jgi:hypothetical protein